MTEQTNAERWVSLEEELTEIRLKLEEIEAEMDMMFISVPEAARMLGMDYRTMLRSIRRSKFPIPLYEFPGQNRKFKRRDILKWIDHHRNTGWDNDDY